MKHWRILFAAALAASALSACNENIEGEEGPQVSITATTEAEARTSVDSATGKVSWTPGDAISVFTGTTNDCFTTTGSGSTATFTGPDAKTTQSTYYALYPYDKHATVSSGVITTTLPAAQEGVGGTFKDGLFICAAKSDTRSSFSFRNLCSGIRFSVTQAGIAGMTLRANGGEALAGEVSFTFDGDGIPQVKSVAQQSSSVTLEAPEGGFVPGQWYYIVTLPCTLSTGVTMKYTLDGVAYEVVKSDALTLERSSFGSVADVDGKATVSQDAASSLLWEEEGFKETVTVVYSGTTATATSTSKKITCGTVGAHVWVNLGDADNGKKAEIILSGTTSDGSLKIYGEKKMKLTLNGVSITSAKGPAINIQDGKRVFLHIADGTSNTLVDAATWTDDAYYVTGATSATEDRKGTLFAEGRIIVSGKGSLTVTGKAKNAIATDDYFYMRPGATITIPSAASHGIKVGSIATPDADDYDADGDLIGCTITGGTLDIKVASAGGKAINSESNVKITDGNVTLATTGGVESTTTNGTAETTSAACIKADKDIKVTGGTLTCSSTGAAGKGLNSDGAITIGTIDGGKPVIKISTTGGAYGSSSSGGGPGGGPGGHGGWGGGGFGGGGSTSSNASYAKAIRAEGQIVVYNCDMSVYTAGSGAEGIESKLASASAMDFRGGDVVLYCNDDCINASSGGILFNGSRVFAWSYNNDSIDSNYRGSGAITINDGVVLALSSAGGPEEGIDSDEYSVAVTGGYAFSIGKTQGNTPSVPTTSTAKQCTALLSSINLTAGQYLSAFDSSGKTLFSFRIPFTFSGSYSLVTCPGFASGGTYTIKTGSAAPSSPTMTWEVTSTNPTYQVGFYTGGSASASSTLKTIKFSSQYVKV